MTTTIPTTHTHTRPDPGAGPAPAALELPPGLVLEEQHDINGQLTAAAVFDTAGTYRYLLTRIWNPDLPRACWIMLNPSTADAARTDPTLTRVVRFTADQGLGGLLIVNLFALRSPHPRRLARHHDPVGPHNDVLLRRAARETRGGPVIAAWGAMGSLHDRATTVTRNLTGAGVGLSCYGTTGPVSGSQPRHPLYLPADTPLTGYQSAAAAA